MRNTATALLVAIVLPALLTNPAPSHAETREVPVIGLTIWGPAEPTEAETLAAQHLVREVARATGYLLPVSWGGTELAEHAILIGNRQTLPNVLTNMPVPSGQLPEHIADVTSQSFVAVALPGERILTAGLGTERTARGLLGMSYAIGSLLESLDLRNGVWSFQVSDELIVQSPRVPVRDLYVMGSFGGYPGLSIEQMSERELQDYVDFVVDARYTRVSFFLWRELYLYPGNMDVGTISEAQRAAIVHEYGLYTSDIRTYSENSHRQFRKFVDIARRRGLEVYQMLTPAHALTSLLPGQESDWAGTGHYHASGGCWSKPEVREIARNACQLEMEYFAPVDGYSVWFYDPAGCFCEHCKPSQVCKLLDQFKLVHDLGTRISPHAEYAIGAAPMFVFAEAKIYTQEELDKWVPAFFYQCRKLLGGGRPLIIDHGENDLTSIYRGWVDPTRFRREPMLYSTYGMMGEYGYVVPHVRFGHIKENVHDRTAKHGAEAGMVMTMHNVSNRPGVWSVGKALYGSISDWHELAESFAHYEAKGEAYQPYLEILLADEAVAVTGSAAGQTDPQANYAAQAQHLTAMEDAWVRLQPHAALFRGNIDQVAGFVAAQRWYWNMAKCTDETEFTRLFEAFTKDLASNPVYAHFVQRVPSREDAGFQAFWVWRYFVWDKNNKTGMAPVVTDPEKMLQHERPVTDGDRGQIK